MREGNDRLGRRKFLEMSVATGAAAAGASWPGLGIAQLAHPHESSLDYLDRNQYIHNMELLNVFMPGEPREGKMQMMAIGDRRLVNGLRVTRAIALTGNSNWRTTPRDGAGF
jgi:hypothetical protein